jgi:hypothetical protein
MYCAVEFLHLKHKTNFLIMKKILVLLVMVAATFSSCKKSDSKLIANKWTGVTQISKLYNATGTLTDSASSPLSQLVLELRSDKTFTSTKNAIATNGKWMLVDDKITITATGKDPVTWTVSKLTSEQLVLFKSEPTISGKAEEIQNFER